MAISAGAFGVSSYTRLRPRRPSCPSAATQTDRTETRSRPTASSPSPEDDDIADIRRRTGEGAAPTSRRARATAKLRAGRGGRARLVDPDDDDGPRGRGARAGLATVRDPVGRFLAEARRYPRLSEEEERALGMAVRERGDMNAARTLVVHNLRLVVAIAYQYRRAWANILDLFQEGSVGLMEAVKRWEPKLGPRFGTYAAYWIRAYVLRFLMTNSRLIHVGNTRAGRKLFFRLEKERQKLLAAGHRRDAQAAGRQAGRRREGSGRGAPAPRIARGAVRSARPATRPATRAIPLSERMPAAASRPRTRRPRAELRGDDARADRPTSATA